MEIKRKSKAVAPIEKEIAALDAQIGELTVRKATFEKALSLFKGVAGGAPAKLHRDRPKKQTAEPPAQNQAAG